METRNIPQSPEKVYAAVNNIPSFFRSADLRRFFSQFVETGGFDCFHFRHRPEKQSVKSDSYSANTEHDFNKSSTKKQNDKNETHSGTFCCIIRVTEVKFVELTRTFHQRNWQDSKGKTISSKCLISRLKTSPTSSLETAEKKSSANNSPTIHTDSGTATTKYQTRGEKQRVPADREDFLEDDLLKLPELRPPTVMPQGNVGTPTLHFLKLIQECSLPPSIIRKLQLDFPKSKGKGKYCSVPFNYHTEVVEVPSASSGDDDLPSEHVQVEKEECDSVSMRQLGQNCEDGDCFVKDTVSGDLTQSTSSNSGSDGLTQSANSYSGSGDLTQSTSSNSGSDDLTQSAKSDSGSGSLTQSANSSTCREEPQTAEKTPQPSDSTIDYKEKRRLKKLAKRERQKLMAERIEEKMIEFERGGSGSEEDNDSCEEWERHEAMYDDVTNQGRNKDRLFEEEVEVVWEKGGSGLVFYTDAQYWQEKEGDFDEQTTDDLNVDMSIYYEDGAGDKDIRDFLTLRQEQRRRHGIEKTGRFSAGIGKFEKHTKGFGRKIMEKQGWTEGCGLGSSVQGISDALDNEGKHPKDRQGLGYCGEKLARHGISNPRKRKSQRDVIISTVYDNPEDTDPLEPLKRRNDLSYIKHRNRIN